MKTFSGVDAKIDRVHRQVILAAAKSAGLATERILAGMAAFEGKPPELDDLALLLPQAQVARLLGCSRWSVRRLVQQGFLKPVKVLGLSRFRRAEVVKFAATGGA